jgi:hypothetical protein
MRLSLFLTGLAEIGQRGVRFRDELADDELPAVAPIAKMRKDSAFGIQGYRLGGTRMLVDGLITK